MRVLSTSMAKRDIKNAELKRAKTLLIKKAYANLNTQEVKAIILKLASSFRAEKIKIRLLRKELAMLNRFIKEK
jgi:hypothetical protein